MHNTELNKMDLLYKCVSLKIKLHYQLFQGALTLLIYRSGVISLRGFSNLLTHKIMFVKQLKTIML